MTYIITWQEQDIKDGTWIDKMVKTNIYPPTLAIGYIVRRAYSGIRWFQVIFNPNEEVLKRAEQLPDHKLVNYF